MPLLLPLPLLPFPPTGPTVYYYLRLHTILPHTYPYTHRAHTGTTHTFRTHSRRHTATHTHTIPSSWSPPPPVRMTMPLPSPFMMRDDMNTMLLACSGASDLASTCRQGAGRSVRQGSGQSDRQSERQCAESVYLVSRLASSQPPNETVHNTQQHIHIQYMIQPSTNM